MNKKQIDQSWLRLCKIHKKYLLQHGVKLPKVGTNKYIWLSVLYHRYETDKKKFVHKDEMSRIVSGHIHTSATDQQVRHLKRDGWCLVSDNKGGHRLDPYKVSPEYQQDKQRRSSTVSEKGFQDIKKSFDYRCASCGSKEGEVSWRYGNKDDTIKLQQGHKDPEKPLDNSNTIPQCQFCNRAYKGDFTFDDKGRVRAIANVEPVKRSSEATMKKVYDYLKKRFG